MNFAAHILNSLEDALLMVDLDCNITLLNPAAENLLGAVASEALNKSLDSLVSVVDFNTDDQLRDLISQVIKYGKITWERNKIKLITTAKIKIPVTGSVTGIKDAAGNFIGVVLVLRKDPEYRNPEELVWDVDSIFTKLFRFTPLPLGITRQTDYTIVDVNDAWSKLTGFTREEAIGHTSLELGLARSETLQSVRNLLNTQGQIIQYEIPLFTRSGNQLTVLVSSEPVVVGNESYFLNNLLDITERKKIEDNLHQEKEKFEKITASIPGVICSYHIDPAGRASMPFASHAMKEVYGFDHSEIADDLTPLLSRIVPEDAAHVTATIEHSRQTMEIWNDEFRYNHPTKGQVWIQGYSAPMKEVDGSATWHGIVFDITRRKEAEERLLESENRYTLLFRKSIIPVVLMKLPEVVIADVNEAAENLTGFSRNEMIGRNSAELGLIDLSMRRKVIDDFSNKKNISGFEAKIKTKNGDERVIIINTNPLEINKQPYAITSMHDITERVRAEERLRDSEIRFHSIFHYSPVAIGISRWSDQKIININAAFTNLFGYTPEEAIGRTTAELGIWAELSERSSFFERIKKEERILSLEIPIVLKSGQKRQCMAWVEKTELNGELCIIAQMIDITEQKSAQEELRKSKEKAEESDRLKSHFLANISHEIRTPMNGILGFSDILRTMNPSGEEREKFFSLIQLSGERLMNTINDLIEISSIQAGAAVLSQTIVNINEIIRFHNDFFQSQAQEKGLFLTCHLPLSDARAYIRTDEKKLDSILTNLIRNAIKFTVKGSVEFGYRIQGKEIEFFVRDTGIGIPADRLEVIFDRFIQADLEITRAYEGTGLGLAIAKSYSEMLGGKLRVDSQENSGSTFWFSMPWVEEVMEYQEMPGPGIPFAFDLLHAYTLLIVEDDEVNCQYLLNILKPVFKSVFLAITGNEALSLCSREKTIDVILMDLKMPGMSGYETTRRIREFNKDVVIIAQTAHASKEEISKALESGCDDYITKPYYPEDLALVITRNMKKKLVQDEPLAG